MAAITVAPLTGSNQPLHADHPTQRGGQRQVPFVVLRHRVPIRAVRVHAIPHMLGSHPQPLRPAGGGQGQQFGFDIQHVLRADLPGGAGQQRGMGLRDLPRR